MKDWWKNNYPGERQRIAVEKAAKWAEENRERSRQIKRNWAENNPGKVQQIRLIANAKRAEKRKILRKSDPEFISREALSGMIKRACKLTGKKKNFKTSDVLGYTVGEFVLRIESQFKEGMTWQNHGEWHIDHIKPLSMFIRKGVTDPAIINALSNLQPLWATDNYSKRDRFIG